MSDLRSKPRRPWQPVLLMAAVALALGALLLARGGRPARDTTGVGTMGGDPRGVVAALLEAQRDGDAEGCRRCLAGAALQDFEVRRRTLPPSQFAAELRSGLVDLKGHATTELDQQAPDAATLVLELIFADRNERQQIELRRIDGAWKVTRRAPADRRAPPIPYVRPSSHPSTVFTRPAAPGAPLPVPASLKSTITCTFFVQWLREPAAAVRPLFCAACLDTGFRSAPLAGVPL